MEREDIQAAFQGLTCAPYVTRALERGARAFTVTAPEAEEIAGRIRQLSLDLAMAQGLSFTADITPERLAAIEAEAMEDHP